MEDTVEFLLLLVIVAVVLAGVWSFSARRRKAAEAKQLEDAKAEARRWIDRLGGQVYALTGTDEASKQALADAAERNTAAGAQIEQARTVAQARLAQETAMEGLYYVRAARQAMGIDPGPPLPALPGQQRAGAVSEDREVEVSGHQYSASPRPSSRNNHYYPGGYVAGRPVPAGWYSEPWWRGALVAGAWGVGSALLFSSLFSGMMGVPAAYAYDQGYDAGYDAGQDADSGGDGGGSDGGDYEAAGFDGSDMGSDFGGDFGGGDFGGDF